MYVFERPDGREPLAQLFGGQGQLIIYHFMFAPDWDAGCPHCSFWADNFNGNIVHLAHRDVTLVAVSRTAYAELAAYRQRMRWGVQVDLVVGDRLNFDYQVSYTRSKSLESRPSTTTPWRTRRAPSTRSSACFARIRRGRRSTPARGHDVLNTAYYSSISCPKAATKPVTTCRSSAAKGSFAMFGESGKPDIFLELQGLRYQMPHFRGQRYPSRRARRPHTAAVQEQRRRLDWTQAWKPLGRRAVRSVARSRS